MRVSQDASLVIVSSDIPCTMALRYTTVEEHKTWANTDNQAIQLKGMERPLFNLHATVREVHGAPRDHPF